MASPKQKKLAFLLNQTQKAQNKPVAEITKSVPAQSKEPAATKTLKKTTKVTKDKKE